MSLMGPLADVSDVVRTVPRSTAVSGMMFGAVPLVRLPTVSTSGSNVLIRRLRIVCRARTISAAIGTGSSASAATRRGRRRRGR